MITLNIPIPVKDIRSLVSIRRPRLFKRPYTVRITTPDSRLTLHFRSQEEQDKLLSIILDLIEKENLPKENNQ